MTERRGSPTAGEGERFAVGVAQAEALNAQDLGAFPATRGPSGVTTGSQPSDATALDRG